MTPDQVHFGRVDAVHAARQVTLDRAFTEHPARLVNRRPCLSRNLPPPGSTDLRRKPRLNADPSPSGRGNLNVQSAGRPAHAVDSGGPQSTPNSGRVTSAATAGPDPVWTALRWQGFFECLCNAGWCGHVSDL